jgi:hypothetical protein
MRLERRRTGVSLAKGPAFLIGLALLAYGVAAFIFGADGFSTEFVPDGDINGETFLGIEANGWSAALFAAAGLLLVLGATKHWGAKSVSLIVGLVLCAASVIALQDGSDVVGLFAANNWTKLAWGAAGVALVVVSLLPRVGRRREVVHDTAPPATRTGRFTRDRDRDRDVVRDRETV